MIATTTAVETHTDYERRINEATRRHMIEVAKLEKILNPPKRRQR